MLPRDHFVGVEVGWLQDVVSILLGIRLSSSSGLLDGKPLIGDVSVYHPFPDPHSSPPYGVGLLINLSHRPLIVCYQRRLCQSQHYKSVGPPHGLVYTPVTRDPDRYDDHNDLTSQYPGLFIGDV